MKLFIDSSTNYLYLCCLDGNKNPSFVRTGRFDHSETLVDFLQEFLKQNNIDIKDVKEIYIGRGPGSYTGIRIAGTVGKVLSFLTNAKLYSFSSLDLILAGNTDVTGKVAARITAKKDYSYYKHGILNNEFSVEEDKYGLDTEIDKEATILEMDDALLAKGAALALNILSLKLYKEESNLDYTPNYLRNVI